MVVEGEFEGFGVDLHPVDEVGLAQQIDEVFGDQVFQVVEFVQLELLLEQGQGLLDFWRQT